MHFGDACRILEHMNILYIGDIMGRPGRQVVAEVLPELRREKNIDLVIAQSENVSHGKSMLPRHMEELQGIGIDFFTGGDHSFEREQLYAYLDNPECPVVRPANIAEEAPGLGAKTIESASGSVLVISLLGSVFPQRLETTNPLQIVDEILESYSGRTFTATVVNIHGDYSSEKRVMGYYLDGRVGLVVGDHWHVPSADAMVLPKGTGHITDVGMCGSLHSSLGVNLESIIPFWRDGTKVKREIEESRPYQFNALLAKGVHKAGTETVEHISIIH